MSSVAEIERAIEQLSPEDFATLRAWLVERDAAAWDRQLEDDVAAGRLGALGEEALTAAREGRCTDL